MNLFSRLGRKARKLVRHPQVRIEPTTGMLRLGSQYGGWDFLERDYLKGATIISAGLGEDASFDVEFAHRFGAHILIVDPTPRAIAHFDAISKRTGQAAETGYVHGGQQPVAAYPLDNIQPHQLRLAPSALWDDAGTMKFFAPADDAHVSHSLINFQNAYDKSSAHIEVETIRLSALIADQKLPAPALMKLDIEGAEIEVLASMIADGIYPLQLLIEYDELMVRTSRAMERVNGSIAMLTEHGYICRHYDGDSNFLFEHAAV